MDKLPRPGDLYKDLTDRIYQVITAAVHSQTGEQLIVYQAMDGNFEVYAGPLSMFVIAGNQQEQQRCCYVKIGRSGSLREENAVPDMHSGMQEAREEGVFSHNRRRQPAADGPRRTDGLEACAQSQAHDAQGQSLAQQPEPAQGQSLAHGAFVQPQPQQPEPAQGQSLAHGAPLQPQQPVHARPRTQSPADAKRAQRQAWQAAEESDDALRRLRQMEEREHRREQFRRQENHASAAEELRANPSLLKFLDADTYAERFQVLNEIQDDMTDRLIDDIAVVLDVVIPEGPLSSRFHQLRNIILTRQKYETSRLRR